MIGEEESETDCSFASSCVLTVFTNVISEETLKVIVVLPVVVSSQYLQT